MSMVFSKLKTKWHKAGRLAAGATNITDLLLGIVLVFSLAAAIIPVAQTAGDDLNASGIPLGSLFTSSGVVFILVAVGLVTWTFKRTRM